MKQTIAQLRITIAEADAKEWEALAANAVINAAKCRSLANDVTAPQVFRDIAAAELETADRRAEGNLQMLEVAIGSVNRAVGMSEEEADADAKIFANARVEMKHREDAAAIETTGATE